MADESSLLRRDGGRRRQCGLLRGAGGGRGRRARRHSRKSDAKRDRGGNSALTGHIRFVFNGIEDLRPLVKSTTEEELRTLLERLPRRTEADMWDEVMRVTNNQSDQDLLQVHVTESLKTVHWLACKGHDWVPALAVERKHSNPNGGGFGLQQRHCAILEKAGAQFHYETAAVDLIRDDKGRVTGVQALSPQGTRVQRQGGGARLRQLRGQSADARALPRPRLGHGARARRAVQHRRRPPDGAQHRRHAARQLDDLPCLAAGHRPAAVHRALGHVHAESNRYMHPYSIMVNTNGERFVDEADDLRGRTYAKMGRAIMAQPGGVAFQILDKKVARR